MANETMNNDAAFIWSVADLLRGNYKPYLYAYSPVADLDLHRGSTKAIR
jgi:hypothetical protein